MLSLNWVKKRKGSFITFRLQRWLRADLKSLRAKRKYEKARFDYSILQCETRRGDQFPFLAQSLSLIVIGISH